jgi:hypothetical protein
MNMLMIVFSESFEEDIQRLLSKHHVSAFTAMHPGTGMGEAGRSENSAAGVFPAVRVGGVMRPFTTAGSL